MTSNTSKNKDVDNSDITIAQFLFSLEKKDESFTNTRNVITATFVICLIISIITLNNEPRGITQETVIWNIWESFGVGIFALLFAYLIRSTVKKLNKYHLLTSTKFIWFSTITCLLFAQIVTHLTVLILGPDDRKVVPIAFIIVNWLVISLPLTIIWIGYAHLTNTFRAALRRAIELEREATELRVSHEAEIRVRKAAEEANHHKTSFLADMSHELRGPLGNIRSSAKFLSKDALSDKQKRYQAIIIQDCEHILQIINDLLDMETINAGKLKINQRPEDITILAKEVINKLYQQAQEKGIMLSISLNSPIPLVDIDETRIKQIIQNLVSNAIKYTDEGEISIIIKEIDDLVQVDVIDTGLGIPVEAQERIFGQYEQARPEDQKTGTGLGLAITKRLVELHGGTIWVTSQEDVGSTFSFTVPIAVQMNLNAI